MEQINIILERFHQVCRKVIPPVYFAASLVLMFIASYLFPVSHLVFTPLRIAGVLLALAGLVFGAWGVLVFRKAGTPLKPFEKPALLVRSGPYQFSRNPVYLGMLSVLTGAWIASGTFTPMLVVLLFYYIIQEAFIRQEEKFLQEIFADEYRQYCESVRRWL